MKTTRHTTKVLTNLSIIVLSLSAASTAPVLDGVSYEPGFVSAGDRVNISANLQATEYPDKDWNPDKSLKAVLKPGNRLTEEYITIEEDRDESIGFLYPEGVWNQRYRVKVDSGAPTGRYGFEIHIQYTENGEPTEIRTEEGNKQPTVIRKFSMPVDREGVDISGNVRDTRPDDPRPGDKDIEQHIVYTNTGNKPIEDVEIRPNTPGNMTAAHSEDEKLYINRLESGESAERRLALDTDEDLDPGLHTVRMQTVYEDRSGNRYSEPVEAPLRVEGSPDLELAGANRPKMKAGEEAKLNIKVQNTGEQDAESTSARLIAERAQPFSLEDRSSYIGEIESGDTGQATLKVSADRSAALRSHNLRVQLRANGDSEEGDTSVYTFTGNKDVEIAGRSQSPLIYVGLVSGFLIVASGAYRYNRSKQSEGGDKEDE
jgi:CARDB.